MSAAVRLFVALVPPRPVSQELARWTRHAVAARLGVRRLEPEQLHATLCFLGHQQPMVIDALANSLERLATPPGELEVGAPAWLPPRRPRVLAVELNESEGSLATLQRRLSDEFAELLDWEPERRRFRPHITLARMSAEAGRTRRAQPLPPTPPLRFTAERLVLYRSRLQRSGAEYEPLASVTL